ncbi:N-acetyl-1-D-myo-inositol-2-amino-2-deoxy-alpha-D-glucopyranoside deacetylase [Humibacillus sp. DSM 29435]|uniref:N-acetyl-1-D-myo-inositol-2-amino-2-deoxy-alpha- D-glucopyranoside deacetylase n=1 Tax=Humibacillus sp. DSM 29435 TaxID=1869167 RepID=UPI0008723E8C|nr:N-acetyl-1-D-myo-inositol-2-amino-2-deoxy-alpha-D-glucopyranoside deacetylase [Humibacillus sp. DSM 29435]OFE16795.1 N-acetyl-1-D-myo-inositol-2-amino-2-deoxy-alpha-D-glucopyranoside deacetylase [Humibacillus sp. DSM 29435]
MSQLLFVHAHPDDETLTCGIAMAHHVARGDDVHVLTCTLGEEGEVIPPDLRHLEGAVGDPLGPYRHGELTEALRRLGVTGRVLGAGGGRLSRYRDSGMVGSAAAARLEAFVNADLDEAGELVATVVRDLRPDVVVTYDRFGGYEHPDHVQTHRVTRTALASLADTDLPGRTFEILTPVSWAREDRAFVRSLAPSASGLPGMPLTLPAVDDPFPRSVVADEQVTHAVHDGAALAAKNDALRAHATQVLVVSDDVYALSNLIAARSSDREGYRRVEPRSWMPLGAPATERGGLLD